MLTDQTERVSLGSAPATAVRSERGILENPRQVVREIRTQAVRQQRRRSFCICDEASGALSCRLLQVVGVYRGE